MNNLKHTKGEWYINPRASTNVMCNSKSVANCSGSQSGDNLEEEQANAKLIASAPDMLEALIFSDMFPITTESEEQKAIQIAKELGWKMDMPLEIFVVQVRRNAINKATK